ncbi:MAG: type III pantothenate kinase, partial [Magnetococcales bacterium]|nr:type III pantothenate kinase [Magnetococcales bacterium]
MLLVVDVGNTHIVIGIYQGAALLHHWRVATRVERTGDEYGILIASFLERAAVVDVQHAIIASVVPPVQAALVRAMRRYLRLTPLVVGPGLKSGIAIHYDHPKEVG